MGRCLGIFAVLTLLLAGCAKKHPADNVTYVADDDPRMNAAIEKARSTVNTFITALKTPRASQTAFSVKMAFTDGPNTEHMWLTPVRFDGKHFQGTISNEPEQVKSVKMGQQASVEPSKSSDWMFVENRKLVGGYTIRALRDALPPSERAAFDKGATFVIE